MDGPTYSGGFFTLPYLGKLLLPRSPVSNTGGLDGVEQTLTGRYLAALSDMMLASDAYLEDVYSGPWALAELSIRDSQQVAVYFRTSSRHNVTLSAEVFPTDRLVFCQCYCVEVVTPRTPATSGGGGGLAGFRPGLCYAYLRKATERRCQVPEASLQKIEARLTDWLLRNSHLPRPPLVVLMAEAKRASAGPARQNEAHLFLAPCLTIGREVVKRICRSAGLTIGQYRWMMPTLAHHQQQTAMAIGSNRVSPDLMERCAPSHLRLPESAYFKGAYSSGTKSQWQGSVGENLHLQPLHCPHCRQFQHNPAHPITFHRHDNYARPTYPLLQAKSGLPFEHGLGRSPSPCLAPARMPPSSLEPGNPDGWTNSFSRSLEELRHPKESLGS
ncbi:unnamed protein product [Protopolystoma xenopodis]|uniref:Uncharacterized protein n=1 Tax=Protopolystoma xenopodis TaxID=117903 RepID=A0A3S5CI57_9PLAT|nr:unnamed protein product [Protopolystoma xenopodis]